MNMFGTTNAKTPKEYIDTLEEPRKSEIEKIDSFIRKTVPKLKPYIQSGLVGIGYGKYLFKYATGRELEWPLIGLASRKDYISIYVCATDGRGYVAERYRNKLKASIGKSCIRFKKVEDIDWEVLKQVLIESVKVMK